MIFSPCIFSENYVYAQTSQIPVELQTANTAVDQAFNAVSAAEKAGANVTSLENQLNQAVGLLAQAESAYDAGENNLAVDDAKAVLPIAQQVVVKATAVKENASNSSQAAVWHIIAITVIVEVAFVLTLLLVWRILKRNYIKGLSEAKPEVIPR